MPDPREELRQRLTEPGPQEALRQRLEEPEGSSALGAFLVSFLTSTGDAALAAPSASGDLLAAGAAGLEGTARGLTPGGEGFEFGRRFREQQEMFPANVIRSIPRPTTNEVLAGTRATAFSPGFEGFRENFSTELEALEAADRQRIEAHPIASQLGDFGGLIASLLIARRPLQPRIRRIEDRIMNPRPAPAVRASDNLLNDLDRAFRSSFVRLPARGLFRAGEAGLEAAFLEVLSASENDPMLAAGLAGGAQIASSNLFGGLKSLARGGPGSALTKFTAAAIATGGLWQMVKSATPGGRDRILESMESGFDKTTYAVLLGVLGSAMGARGRGAQVSEPLQDIIEGFVTVPRAGVLALITEFADAPEEEQRLFETTLNKVLADPSYKGEGDREKALVERLRQQLEADE